MNGNISDVEDDELDWDSEDDRDIADIPTSICSAVVVPAFGLGEASSSGTKSFEKFVRMGFSESLVARVLQEFGEDNETVILDNLLTYSVLESSPEGQQLEQTPETSPEEPPAEPDDISSEYEDDCFGDFTDSEILSDNEDVAAGPICGENDTMIALKGMGFSTYEASTAIVRCGPNSSLDELMDFISAAQMAKDSDAQYPVEVHPRTEQKKRRFEHEMSKHKRKRGEKNILTEDDELIRPPNPMIGFGVPTEPFQAIRRNLPKECVGPPYFYYENVALAPKGVWSTISRFLYDVEPEFVDSKYFCAAARKRGYVHNLPIENRYPLLPLPPNTVTEALPVTRRWWPTWDPRTKLNCIQTCIASAKLTEKLLNALKPYEGVEPPLEVQKEVLYQCRKWNLVWVGRNKLAPLECDEVEMLLGFPRNHTRGGGISRTDRFKSLGNSFQVDTVAYHLSVLKERFPKGMNVLSLFTGIGGAEVALHRLGVTLKNVVSVEKEEVNRNIMQSWWEQTNQRGNLVHLTDVQRVDEATLAEMMRDFGGFDLVVGGSPCNNLAGSNRHHRDGLEGKESSLFYDYFRILELVKSITLANNI